MLLHQVFLLRVYIDSQFTLKAGPRRPPSPCETTGSNARWRGRLGMDSAHCSSPRKRPTGPKSGSNESPNVHAKHKINLQISQRPGAMKSELRQGLSLQPCQPARTNLITTKSCAGSRHANMSFPEARIFLSLHRRRMNREGSRSNGCQRRMAKQVAGIFGQVA